MFMMGDLDVIVYIFYKVLNLLSFLIHILIEWREKKRLWFVNLIVLCQISTEDLCKNVICLARNANTLFRKNGK